MKFPERLRELGGEDGRTARRVFEDDGFEPPSGAKERVWASLAAQIGPIAPGGGGASPSIAPAAGKVGAILSGIGIVVAIGAGGVGYWAVSNSKSADEPQPPKPMVQVIATDAKTPPSPPAREPAPQTAPIEPTASIRARSARPSAEVASAPPAPVASEASVGVMPPADAKTSALLQESALVSRARNALRSGDFGGARQLLGQLDREFPRGGLMQEREALAIELLWQSGQRQAASERASAFVRTYPNSPHAARLRAYVQSD